MRLTLHFALNEKRLPLSVIAFLGKPPLNHFSPSQLEDRGFSRLLTLLTFDLAGGDCAP